jgi:hypothetical protein
LEPSRSAEAVFYRRRSKSKTEAGEGRTIPLKAALLKALHHHAGWYTLRFARSSPIWYLFPFGRANHLDPTRPITTIKTAWANLKERAGVTGLSFGDNWCRPSPCLPGRDCARDSRAQRGAKAMRSIALSGTWALIELR